MRISPFVSGIATGAMAGAVVSMVAAGAMLNPSMRRNAKHAAHKAEHAMHRRRPVEDLASGKEVRHFWARDFARCGVRGTCAVRRGQKG